MKLGKQLLGYRRTEVDRLIKDYEEKIQKAEEDNAYLREKLEESKFMYQTAKNEYEKRIDELSNSKYTQIGNVYASVYENADTVYQKAYEQSKSIVENTISAVNGAKDGYIDVVDRLTSEQSAIENKFYALVSLIGDIQIHIMEMTSGTERIRKTINSFDGISEKANREIENLTRPYLKPTGCLKTESKINNNQSFAEFLDNYTGGGSIVDILKIYAGLTGR